MMLLFAKSRALSQSSTLRHFASSRAGEKWGGERVYSICICINNIYVTLNIVRERDIYCAYEYVRGMLERKRLTIKKEKKKKTLRNTAWARQTSVESPSPGLVSRKYDLAIVKTKRKSLNRFSCDRG